MLRQLDYVEVSRFAGKYFNAVRDEASSGSDPEPMADEESQHAAICACWSPTAPRRRFPDCWKRSAKGGSWNPPPPSSTGCRGRRPWRSPRDESLAGGGRVALRAIGPCRAAHRRPERRAGARRDGCGDPRRATAGRPPNSDFAPSAGTEAWPRWKRTVSIPAMGGSGSQGNGGAGKGAAWPGPNCGTCSGRTDYSGRLGQGPANSCAPLDS